MGMGSRAAVAAVVCALLLALGAAAASAAPRADAATADTARLRAVIYDGLGELAKQLREIDKAFATPIRTDDDITYLRILLLGPIATRNDVAEKMRRTGGRADLRRAANSFFGQMAYWAGDTYAGVGALGRGEKAEAARRRAAAGRHLHRARVAQAELRRLLRATA
jgi:hypothetical protein